MIEPRDREWYLVELICLYYNFNPTGGSLHIVLDDGNADRASVEFCKKWAEDHKDHAGYYIACLILDWFEVFEPLMLEQPYRWHGRAWEKSNVNAHANQQQ